MSAIGFDVGGTKLLAVAGERELKRATPSGGPAVVDAIVAVVDELGGADAVGLGIAGLVDGDGVLRVGPNLPGIVGYPFREELARRLGVPVVVENDATAAMWAEVQVGAARGARDAVLVTLGTGIGGGQLCGGVLQRGAHGFAGEPGHMVVDPDGPACVCGRRGCWERYASGAGLAALGREVGSVVALAGGSVDAVRGEHVVSAARQGDAGARDALARFGWWVALGVANLVSILDPEVVVVGGGIVEAGELLMAPVRDAFAGLVLAPAHRPPVRVVAAELGERAGAVGAALLAQPG